MLVTVTNLSSSVSLNSLDTLTAGTIATTGPATLSATGGARVRPLPYPFGHVELAASGSKQLGMNVRDWRHKVLPGVPMEPGEEWQQLVQGGVVSVALAVQAGQVDPESVAVDTI